MKLTELLRIRGAVSELSKAAEDQDTHRAELAVNGSPAKISPEESLLFLAAIAPLLIAALTLAKIFANDKADEKLNEVIAFLQDL